MSLLSCSCLGVTIGSKAILSDVSLMIDVGKVTAIVGPNGAGSRPCCPVWPVYASRRRGRPCWTTPSCRA